MSRRRKRRRRHPVGNPARVVVPPTRLQRWAHWVRRSPGWEVALTFDVLVVGFAVWCALAGMHDQAEYDALDSRGVTATATVVDVTRHWGRFPSSHVYVDFDTPAGPVYHAKTSAFDWTIGRPEPGDQAMVRYDPQDPTGSVRDVRVQPATEIPWLEGVGGPLLAVWMLWGFHRRNRRSK